jgi:hypothetical protein
MNRRVQFAPEALDQLRRLEKRIADAGAPMTAERTLIRSLISA